MNERRPNSQWTFEKKIGVSGILSVFLLAGSILSVYTAFDRRMTSAELAVTYQRGVNDQLKENQKEIKADTNVAIGKVESSLRDLNGKVDMLLQRK